MNTNYFMTCLKCEIRSDSGKTEKWFKCTCPYDDRQFIRGPDKVVLDPVCNVWSIGSEAITRSDKESLSTLEYDIGFDWKYQEKEVTLLACCPKGEDCGTSCETEDGTKDVCVEETKVIPYLTRVSKDYSQTQTQPQPEPKNEAPAKAPAKATSTCQTNASASTLMIFCCY